MVTTNKPFGYKMVVDYLPKTNLPKVVVVEGDSDHEFRGVDKYVGALRGSDTPMVLQMMTFNTTNHRHTRSSMIFSSGKFFIYPR